MAGDDEPAHVLPHVFLGSKVHARDRELLARLQITHVLNVRDFFAAACRLEAHT